MFDIWIVAAILCYTANVAQAGGCCCGPSCPPPCPPPPPPPPPAACPASCPPALAIVCKSQECPPPPPPPPCPSPPPCPEPDPCEPCPECPEPASPPPCPPCPEPEQQCPPPACPPPPPPPSQSSSCAPPPTAKTDCCQGCADSTGCSVKYRKRLRLRNRMHKTAKSAKLARVSKRDTGFDDHEVDVPILNDKTVKVDMTCNNIVLQKLMDTNMSNDLDNTKRIIQKRAEDEFKTDFNVICSKYEFSYVAHTNIYCQASKDNVHCYAFSH